MFLKSHGLLGPNGWSSFFKITYLQMVPNDGRLLHLYSIHQQLMFFVIFFQARLRQTFRRLLELHFLPFDLEHSATMLPPTDMVH